MDADLDTLVTALYVKTDDLLKAHPGRVPYRPLIGFTPKISDAELITLAVMQALLGHTSEHRWLRYARENLITMFPDLPGQSGYNKRLRKLRSAISWLIGRLAAETTTAGDDVWVVDSTPVECARSRETAKRSDLAGWAEYGYCASHSRYFWGLRLHLVCTLHGLPVGWALTGAKADERAVLEDILAGTAAITPDGSRRQILIGDKNYFGSDFEIGLDQAGIDLLRPARKARNPDPGPNSSNPSDKSSSRSTKHSRANSTSNATKDAPSPESAPASPNASSHSPPRSGTTKPSDTPSDAH